ENATEGPPPSSDPSLRSRPVSRSQSPIRGSARVRPSGEMARPTTGLLTSGILSGASGPPVATSHLLIRPSDPPEKRVRPSGAKASDSTPPECAWSTSRSARACATSQNLTDRSSLPDASIRPPSRNAVHHTWLEWPLSVARASPPSTSHSLIVLALPDARYRPSGENETIFLRVWAFLWPLSSISRGSCGLVRSHIRAPDSVPAARYRPSG